MILLKPVLYRTLLAAWLHNCFWRKLIFRLRFGISSDKVVFLHHQISLQILAWVVHKIHRLKKDPLKIDHLPPLVEFSKGRLEISELNCGVLNSSIKPTLFLLISALAYKIRQSKEIKRRNIIQGVLAFCDFWFQSGIMKCGDHEFRGPFLV